MLIRLLILVTFLPVLEIYVLIESGRMIGVWPTVLLVVLTGIAGSWLMRQQGLVLLRRIQNELANGQMPAAALLDGALLIAGGMLLLTPGFCTDLLGATMLIPATRHLWCRWLQRWLTRQVATGHLRIHHL